MRRSIPIVLFIFFFCSTAVFAGGDVKEWVGAYGGPAEARVVVAKTSAEWRSLWALVGDDSHEPPVEFDQEFNMGVGIFLGTRMTGG